MGNLLVGLWVARGRLQGVIVRRGHGVARHALHKLIALLLDDRLEPKNLILLLFDNLFKGSHLQASGSFSFKSGLGVHSFGMSSLLALFPHLAAC